MTDYKGPDRRKRSGSILDRVGYSFDAVNVMRHTDTHRVPNATIAEPPKRRIWASKPNRAQRRQSTLTPESVREIRLSLGLTQAEFGALIGVSKISSYYWEAGLRRPGLIAEKLILQLSKDKSATVTNS